MGSFSIWHWLVVLVIVVMVFGTKRLKNIGQDIGDAVKNFKQALNDSPNENNKPPENTTNTNQALKKPE